MLKNLANNALSIPYVLWTILMIAFKVTGYFSYSWFWALLPIIIVLIILPIVSIWGFYQALKWKKEDERNGLRS